MSKKNICGPLDNDNQMVAARIIDVQAHNGEKSQPEGEEDWGGVGLPRRLPKYGGQRDQWHSDIIHQ